MKKANNDLALKVVEALQDDVYKGVARIDPNLMRALGLNRGDIITIPYDGVFYIDGVHAFPSDWLPLHLKIDDKEIIINQNWTKHENKNVTLVILSTTHNTGF